jgi:hypothetical protein
MDDSHDNADIAAAFTKVLNVHGHGFHDAVVDARGWIVTCCGVATMCAFWQ